MALPASSVFSATTPTFQIRHLRNEPVRLHRLCRNLQLSPTLFRIKGNVPFGNRNKVKMQLNMMGIEGFWEAAPKPVKEFPWRKAWDALLKRSMIIGQTTLKWSLITLFICTSISDVIFSISTNRELLIPLGLFIGCLMTDFLKETLQEMFSDSEEEVSETRKGLDLDMPLVLIGCFFVAVKAVSTVFFAARTQVLLLHVANGGLLQVLWIWRNLLTENDELKNNSFFTGQDAPLSTSAEE